MNCWMGKDESMLNDEQWTMKMIMVESRSSEVCGRRYEVGGLCGGGAGGGGRCWNRQPKRKTPWLPAKCQVAEVDPQAAVFHGGGLSACHLPVQYLWRHSTGETFMKSPWNWMERLAAKWYSWYGKKPKESRKHAIPLPGDPLPASRPPRQPSPRHLNFTFNHIERHAESGYLPEPWFITFVLVQLK